MERSSRFTVAVLVIASLQLTACREASNTPEMIELASHIEHIDGTEFSRVTLTERAIERIDLKTDEVRELAVTRSRSLRKCVPYSSLIYDTQGRTWVYTSPEDRTFVRHKVVVDYIEGDMAVLSDGPPVGTVVASVGVAELYGTEFEVGH